MTKPRVLLIRPDHLGDVLLTLPAVAALRQALPQAHIACAVGPSAAEILRRCPSVDTVETAPFPPLTLPPEAGPWAKLVPQVAGRLRGRFDVALLPRPDDPWSGPVIAAAGIPARIGYAAPRTRRFLTLALPLAPGRHAAEEALAVSRAAVEVLAAEGAADAPPANTRYLRPTRADAAEACAALAPVAHRVGKHPILLHPGSGWLLKNWSPARWGKVAAELGARYSRAALVVGGPGEDELVEAVLTESRSQAARLVGQLSLGGLAALQQRARVVVATDAGPLHLAALVGTPVVGLYGPVGPEQFGPWCPRGRQRVVRRSLPCSPCGTLIDPPCTALRDPACIAQIAVEDVLAAVNDLLSSRARHRAGT